MIQNIINHIVFVLDASSSMQSGGKDQELIKFVDSEVAYLATRSKDLNQETRVSVVTFANTVNRLIYDMDVLRLPSIKSHYKAYGSTAMLDGLGATLDDLQKYTPPFANISVLVYLVTDGQNNRYINYNEQKLKQKLDSLPENYTVAVFVPDQTAVFEAKRFGLPAGNISVWNADGKKGVEESAVKIRATTENYMQARSQGIRGTKNLFQINTNISTQKVAANLDVLSADKYMVINVRKDKEIIKETVEAWSNKPYVVGSAYYQLTKPEKVQANKNVIVKHKRTGKVYEGAQARNLIGLPNHEVKCSPTELLDYLVFIQSSSVNRHLVGGTELIVLL